MLSLIARTGLRRGLRTGSRPWFYAAVTAGALELLRRALSEQPKLVYQAEVQPGERLEIRTIFPDVEQNAKAGK